jgi:hypothetical protein
MNSNFVPAKKIGEYFTLHEAEEDRLLDSLSILELHGDLARISIVDARTAFTRLFPYFFPKETQPNTFSELARHFLPQEDLGLAFRQENLKVGVERTIAFSSDAISIASANYIDSGRAGRGRRAERTFAESS